MTSDLRTTPSLPEIDLGREARQLESLAALLDGDLAADRRAEILASLDRDDLDLLAEVEALAGEVAEVSFDDVESEDGPRIADADDADAGDSVAGDEAADGDLPDNVVRGPWSRRVWAVGTALAAAVALAVLAPRFFLPQPPTPQSVVGSVDASAMAEATGQLFWSPTRGLGGASPLQFDALSDRDSLRLGVLATDLEVALRSGHEERLRSLEGDLERVLASSPPLRTLYLDLVAEGAPAEELLDLHQELQSAVSGSVDDFHYRYGIWLRAAWLAAESGELNFFRGGSARALDALEPPNEDLALEIRDLRTAIRGLGNDEADLARLSADLEEIARRRAGSSTR